MNILFLTRRYLPDIGGVETHVNRVANELSHAGHRVTILTEFSEKAANLEQKSPKSHSRYISAKKVGDGVWPSKIGKIANRINSSSTIAVNDKINEKNTKEPIESHKIIVYRLPKVKDGWVKKFFIWKELFAYRSLFENNDVIHCHDVFFWYLPFRFLFPRKKVFITFHGYEGVYPPRNKAIIVRRISERLANGALLVGDYIRKWYGSHTSYVTYGGVDLDAVSPMPVVSKENGLRLLFVGRLEKDTSVNMYLTTLRHLRENGFEFTFTACGEGSYQTLAATLGKVELVTDVRPYIKEADIVLASSYLSIIQAMAYGKLVVAVYDNPLKEDYLKMAPFARWIVIVSSESELRSFFDSYRKNSGKYTRMLEDGRHWAQQQTWQQVTALYYELWQGLKPRLLPRFSMNKQQ